MTLTIVHRVSDYYPHSGYVNNSRREWNGYRFVQEQRHWIVAMMHYLKIGTKQPTWSIEADMYHCAFLPPHFPVPTISQAKD